MTVHKYKVSDTLRQKIAPFPFDATCPLCKLSILDISVHLMIINTTQYLAIVFFFGSSVARAQDTEIIWEAFIDYRGVEGETHPNVADYDLRVTDDGGPLRDFATGTDLDASVTVISEGNGEPNDFGLNSPPNAGSPAHDLFNGIVVVGNDGIAGIRALDEIKISLVFKGLDSSKRYTFRATTSRGGNYDDRWSVFGIVGSDANVSAHIDASDNQNLFTRATFDEAVLEGYQVALNSGDNKAGSLIGWDNIEPGSDGEFTIEAEQYGGPTPFGNAAEGVASRYAYGLSAIYLAEIESTGDLRITENPPASLFVPEGATASFSIEATSSAALEFQWQRAAPGTEDFTDIVGVDAQNATYASPQLTVADHQASYRCVVKSAGFELPSAATVVEVDGVAPSITSVEASINFDAVYVTFSEPMKLALLNDRTNYAIEGLFVNDVTVRNSTTVRLHTSQQPKAGQYSLVTKELEDRAGNAIDSNTSTDFTTFTFASETVGLEIWEKVGGAAVTDLRNFARFPTEPDIDYSTSTIDSDPFFGAVDQNTYGGRFRAWLLPEESGSYEFFLLAIDEGEFRISEGTLFAPLEDPEREPDLLAAGDVFSEASEPISLEAGRKYAVEVIWKEANGLGDRVQLTWRKVGETTAPEELGPIPAKFFCYFGSTVIDTDGDGMSDAYEILNDLNASTNDANGDLDSDGLNNAEEHDLGTAANAEDTDGDGLSDKVETGTGIFVSAEDTGSDPQIADTDTDTLGDGGEVQGGTDPNKLDTDGDTFADNVELALNTDPTLSANKPDVVIGVDTGGWNLGETWSDGQAPQANQDYVVINSLTAEVSAVDGEFGGNSLSLIGPGMSLRLNHTETASGNVSLSNTTLKIRNPNTLNGTLALNGDIIFDGQGHEFNLGATLSGAPLLTMQGDDTGTGFMALNGAATDFTGLITVTGTDVVATAPGSLGNGSILLVNGGITFAYDYESPTALLKIRGGDFRLVLDADIKMADFVAVDENESLIFSLMNLGGPGPYTANDLLEIFGFGEDDDSVSGGGTLTLTGNAGDTDLDGLPDEWETTYFGNLEAGPGGNTDGDSLINLAELAADRDPNKADDPISIDPDPADPPAIAVEIGTVTKDASEVGLSFPVGTNFDVEYSEDLINWSVIATDVTADYKDAEATRVDEASGYYRGVVK